MEVKRTVKRLFAVGAGVAMLGATAMGALAAADLKDYPSMFVTDGKFNGFFVVGEKAASVDNLAMTDIAASMMYPKAADKKTTTVSGDAWMVGTSSKFFELANSNASDSAITGESLRDINTFIGDDELQALGDGVWATNERSYDYQQFLFFDIDGAGAGSFGSNTNLIVKYAESDDDVTSDFFLAQNDRQIARYKMEFSSTAQSDVTDSVGSADTTGTYLDDFENTNLDIMGKAYTVVLARRPDTVPDQSIRLILMAGSTRDTLLEGESKTYTVGDKTYDVSLTYIDDDEAKFSVNGEATNKLKVGETYVLKDKSEVGVSEVLYQNYAGGIHSATFFVGASKMELRDDQITDAIGSEDIDGSTVIITGTDNNATFTVSTIEVNMTAEDDYFLGAGEKLSDVIAKSGEEKEILFGQNWDVEYKGISEEATHDLRMKTSGSRRYELELYDGDGKAVSIPVAYAEGNINLSLGRESQNPATNSRSNQKQLINEGLTPMFKDDYFILTGGSAADGSAKSYLLTYSGADAVTKTSPKIKFKNAGTGETLEYSVSTNSSASGTVATIKLGGYSFDVYAETPVQVDDFQITADLNGDGTRDGSSVNFVDSYGSQWTIGNVTGNGSVSTEGNEYIRIDASSSQNADDYDNFIPSAIRLNISATSDPEVRAAIGGVTLKTPEGKTEVSYGYTSMGAFITFNEPASDPDEFIMAYPEKQRLPQVYFTSGATTSSTSATGDLAPVTVVDATKLDSEIASAGAQNLVVVGGPCVNTVAAELLGNPAQCAEGFTPGKARVKLFENGANVAMLVAGYSGADTRLAGKVVAHRWKELTGSEVEIEGTTQTDATISAPSVAAPVVETPVAE